MGLSIERNVYSEYAEKLESIEKLCAQPISEEVHEEIIHSLDEVHKNLSECDTTAAKTNLFAQSYLKELQEKAVFLYGKVDDSFHQYEIDVIKEETASLAATLQQKDLLTLASIIDSLKAHINQLLESYSPALSERRVLVYAKITLEQAEALLKGQLIQDWDMSEWTYLETEAIIEELAEYLGNNDKVSVRLLMSRLTPAQKKLVMGYPESERPALVPPS
jgi:DNA gyrase/topoisomerase IV subunit A